MSSPAAPAAEKLQLQQPGWLRPQAVAAGGAAAGEAWQLPQRAAGVAAVAAAVAGEQGHTLPPIRHRHSESGAGWVGRRSEPTPDGLHASPFRAYMEGRLPGHPPAGEAATPGGWWGQAPRVGAALKPPGGQDMATGLAAAAAVAPHGPDPPGCSVAATGVEGDTADYLLAADQHLSQLARQLSAGLSEPPPPIQARSSASTSRLRLHLLAAGWSNHQFSILDN